ncbi:MAG: hypothetical protein Q8K17_00790 [Pseudohongiella sp.]|nr:hypothetical protein [Pseudohongiella sp.]MDP2091508.1 hypothetical protein [Pseudohongiella sp.]MDP2285324.1 hypothetical protein [Pseudohongiella sp.]
MRELNSIEIEMVNGAGFLAFFRDAILGGLVFETVKAVGSWAGDTFLASDGSSGSRYPIDQCERCS